VNLLRNMQNMLRLMPKGITFVILLLWAHGTLFSQQGSSIKQMIWGPDYQVYLKLSNDSSYALQVEQLFHANPEDIFSRQTEFIYYPVNFDSAWFNQLQEKTDVQEEYTFDYRESQPQIRKVTLWGTLNKSLGGSWVHFINCMVLALETRELDLTAPLLTRPESKWKPNPVTESYKRTKKWKYYLPIEYSNAKKEYKKRLKNKQLGDIKSIPPSYIKLFLKTDDKQYKKLLEQGKYVEIAKVDLVKLMLGAGYLGETQIDFIKSRVLLAIKKYNAKQMPTVLIFDEYQAAVAMRLDEDGYYPEKMVFQNEDKLSPEEISQRESIIRGIISLINEKNKMSFRARLQEQYK
jgi:hypothetical protein